MPELTELLAQLLFVLLPLVTIKAFKPVDAFTPLNSRAVPQGRGSELKGGPCLVPSFATLTQWAASGNVYLASVQRMGKRIGLLFCKPSTSRTPDGNMVLDSKMLLAGQGTSGQFAFHENVQHALNNVYPYFNDTADVDAKGELIPSQKHSIHMRGVFYTNDLVSHSGNKKYPPKQRAVYSITFQDGSGIICFTSVRCTDDLNVRANIRPISPSTPIVVSPEDWEARPLKVYPWH